MMKIENLVYEISKILTEYKESIEGELDVEPIETV